MKHHWGNACIEYEEPERHGTCHMLCSLNNSLKGYQGAARKRGFLIRFTWPKNGAPVQSEEELGLMSGEKFGAQAIERRLAEFLEELGMPLRTAFPHLFVIFYRISD